MNSNVQYHFYSCLSEKEACGRGNKYLSSLRTAADGRTLSVCRTCATRFYHQTELTVLNQCHWHNRPISVIVEKAHLSIVAWTRPAPWKWCSWLEFRFHAFYYLRLIYNLNLWHLGIKEAGPHDFITLIGLCWVMNRLAELKTQLAA